MMVSFPFPAQITSSPGVPSSRSFPGVPVIVQITAAAAGVVEPPSPAKVSTTADAIDQNLTRRIPHPRRRRKRTDTAGNLHALETLRHRIAASTTTHA